MDGEALLRVVGVVGRDREDRRVLFLIRLKANSINMVVLVNIEIVKFNNFSIRVLRIKRERIQRQFIN